MYYGFENMIYTLQQWGVVDVILPFVLIFTIVFAVLEKTAILGKDEAKTRKYATVVAMVVAFAVIVPHVTGTYYYGFDAVQIINNALPQVALLLVAVVMMMLTIGLWTGKAPDGSKGIGIWFTMASVIIVVAIFVASMGWWAVPYWVYDLLNSDVVPLVIALLVFGVIINFIAGEKKDRDTSKPKMKDDIKEFLNG